MKAKPVLPFAVFLLFVLGAWFNLATGKPQAIDAGQDTDVTQRHLAEDPADLPNFHKVHDYLYRGGAPTARGLSLLKELGVKTIFDLRQNGEKTIAEGELARKLGMKYIALPMDNHKPTKAQEEMFLSTCQKASEDPLQGAVFVHCHHGSDRTGCLIGIWRVSHDQFSFDQAYKEMRKYYFGAKFVNLTQAVREACPTGLVVGTMSK